MVEYLVQTINSKLEARFLPPTVNAEAIYAESLEVALLNFPGVKPFNSLGGLLTNMASESLNYYCSQQFMKMVE